MLVLNRRLNESIVIGGNIIVTVLSVHGQHARLGITAPRGIVIDRTEVHQRKLAEHALAVPVGSTADAAG
jgi:carbon storage regulator